MFIADIIHFILVSDLLIIFIKISLPIILIQYGPTFSIEF